jgi:hypothetical protein
MEHIKEQTAVGWLIEQLTKTNEGKNFLEQSYNKKLIKKAEQMYEGQIKSAHYHNRCIDNQTFDCTMKAFENAEQYYNKLYK